MDLSSIPIREISTCAIALPLAIVTLKFKTGDRKIRLFFLFLLLGALVDGLGWLIYGNGLNNFYLEHAILQYGYLFFEALYFVWLCTEFLKLEKVRQLRQVFFALLTLVFFIKGAILLSNLNNPFQPSALSSLMDGLFLASISFLSAFALLQLAERIPSLLTYPWFWILSGIFFYCFGSFFIDLMISVGVMEEIWGIRNIVNIIQYGFFTTGLVFYKSPMKSEN